MNFIEGVPADLAFCEFDCRMSTCPPDCPWRNEERSALDTTRADADTLEDAGLIFFDREPEAFNFQSRTPETANISHLYQPWPEWSLWVLGSLGIILATLLILLA